MIVDGNNTRQRNILVNKCFYQTTVKLMNFFANNGSSDYANKTIEAISAYLDTANKKKRSNLGQDYSVAFETLDNAIRNVANKVFYIYGSDSYNRAYDSFCNYNYVQTVRSQLHKKR